MKTIEHTIRLASDQHYGRYAPPTGPGFVLRLIPDVVRRSILMGFEGRATPRGRPPQWLIRASDVRFVQISGDDDTILHFEAPVLGDAAEAIYAQQEFWDTRPSPEDTGFDLLAEVVRDVCNRDAESDRYDSHLLVRLARFKTPLAGDYCSLAVCGHRFETSPAVFDQQGLANAIEMAGATPAPNRVRVAGTLDMIRASTETFAVKLDDGQEVRGVIASGDIGDLSLLFRKRVLVLGRAVYHPSGTLLRVDAEQVSLSENEPSFWSRMPQPNHKPIDKAEFRKPQGPKSGLAAIMGKWPGDESDEEIDAALKELS